MTDKNEIAIAKIETSLTHLVNSMSKLETTSKETLEQVRYTNGRVTKLEMKEQEYKEQMYGKHGVVDQLDIIQESLTKITKLVNRVMGGVIVLGFLGAGLVALFSWGADKYIEDVMIKLVDSGAIVLEEVK